MIFISLSRFRKKPTKEMLDEMQKRMEKSKEQGTKFHGVYWTLGRYDAVAIYESPDEKGAMKGAINISDLVSTETMVAVPREEAMKLVE